VAHLKIGYCARLNWSSVQSVDEQAIRGSSKKRVRCADYGDSIHGALDVCCGGDDHNDRVWAGARSFS
jgi:hypothetical protein